MEKSFSGLPVLAKIYEIDKSFIKRVEVSPELWEYVFKGIPQEYNLLEMVIYIYLRMCKVLRYKEESFINLRDLTAKSALDLKVINSISPSNNSVNDFEFNVIFSRILLALGIDAEVKYRKIREEVNGTEMSFVTFDLYGFNVRASALESAYDSDLYKVKVHAPITGFKSSSYEDFMMIVERVYDYFKLQNEKDTPEEVFDTENMSFEDRETLLINSTNSCGLKGIEGAAYCMNTLCKLFSTSESDIDYIENLKGARSHFGIIISLIKRCPDGKEEVTYLLYDYDYKLKKISVEDLQKFYDIEIFKKYGNLAPKAIKMRPALKK